ncbi:hypothetical protein OIDMADRAFT_32123 [Oidiodendron maius Zn]|uniref:Uncharacterized protein n=1 Tax=Oidiodendron maius (strain Zn) TaxID=913774 RepID=A0A0C3CDV1_OIDMZ|nr:hypothetical protein OIDMADRAFT_32123 [Oidiodendron maius Zn]
MFGRSRFTQFATFLALLGPALAASLYRYDTRAPEEVRALGGIMSRNPDGAGTVLQHVTAVHDDDPWVSTTSSKALAKCGAKCPGTVYIYKIDPTGLNYVNTVKTLGDDHPHPGEKEFSINGMVPWNNIIQVDTYQNGKKIKTTTREEFDTPPSSPKSAPKSPGHKI